MPEFLRVDVYNKLGCQSAPQLLGSLYPWQLKSAGDIGARPGEEAESMSFAFDRVDNNGNVRPIVSKLVGRTISRVVWSGGLYDEWRNAQIVDGRRVGGLITVTANPIYLDLAESADSSSGRGLVSVLSNNQRVFSFAPGPLTAQQIWDTYIIPSSPSYVVRDTIDAAINAVTIPAPSWNRLTPWALALYVRDTLRQMDVQCEILWRRNGSTNFGLGLVTQVGSSAMVPVFHPRTSLKSLKRSIDTTKQVNRLFTTGDADPNGIPGIPGRSRWIITNVDSVNKKVTLTDPNGGAGPIGNTDQWKLNYLLRCKTGRTFQIQGSDPVNQTVTLLSVSLMAVGEMIEFRLDEPGTNDRTTSLARIQVSGIGNTGTSGEYIQLTGSTLIANDQFHDWYAVVFTSVGGSTVRKSVRINSSTFSNQRLIVGSGNASGVVNTDYVEFHQFDGAGELPSYLEHATYVQPPPTGYGLKCADLNVQSVVGVAQYVPNAFMRQWPVSTSPPTGYTISGTFARDAVETRYGGYSIQSNGFGEIRTDRIDVPHSPGNRFVAIRAYVLFTTFVNSGVDDPRVDLDLLPLDASGTPTGASLGQVTLWWTGHTIAGQQTNATLNAWNTMQLFVQLAATDAPYGLQVRLRSSNVGAPASQIIGNLDTVEVYGFQGVPANSYEFGDAPALHQAANQYLNVAGAPIVSYTVSVQDLERNDPATFARNAITIGGNVRVVDTDFGIDTSVRVLRRQRDFLTPTATTLDLANSLSLLSQQLAVNN